MRHSMAISFAPGPKMDTAKTGLVLAATLAFLLGAVATFLPLHTDSVGQFVQSICHSLTLVGMAGVCLSFRANATLPLTLGILGLMMGLTEDFATVFTLGPNWEKDIVDGGQRMGLLLLFLLRIRA